MLMWSKQEWLPDAPRSDRGMTPKKLLVNMAATASSMDARKPLHGAPLRPAPGSRLSPPGPSLDDPLENKNVLDVKRLPQAKILPHRVPAIPASRAFAQQKIRRIAGAYDRQHQEDHGRSPQSRSRMTASIRRMMKPVARFLFPPNILRDTDPRDNPGPMGTPCRTVISPLKPLQPRSSWGPKFVGWELGSSGPSSTSGRDHDRVRIGDGIRRTWLLRLLVNLGALALVNGRPSLIHQLCGGLVFTGCGRRRIPCRRTERPGSCPDRRCPRPAERGKIHVLALFPLAFQMEFPVALTIRATMPTFPRSPIIATPTFNPSGL